MLYLCPFNACDYTAYDSDEIDDHVKYDHDYWPFFSDDDAASAEQDHVEEDEAWDYWDYYYEP